MTLTGHPAETLILDGQTLSIDGIVRVVRDRLPVTIADSAWERIADGRRVVDEIVARGDSAYGVTTGVGSQKDYHFKTGEAEAFNRRLLVAHATVASDSRVPDDVVRAALLVQLNGFVSGRSGVRPLLVRALLDRLVSGSIPIATAGSSVGASDLVPLAQMALSLLGATDPVRAEGDDIRDLRLAAKEALSLMNSNAVSIGKGALCLSEAERLLSAFELGLCMSLEGFRGNLSIIDPAVVDARPQRGQRLATLHMRSLLRGSALFEEGQPRFLQDPLSFRCAPQVHGAAHSALTWIWRKWETELNSVADNPVVDFTNRRLVSHGNMDTTLLTLGLDTLRSAFAEVIDVSAQRLHKLHWPSFSGLPAGLAADHGPTGGVQFLNLGHIAESHAATARAAASPTLPTYQGQLADGVEDHATPLPLAVDHTERLIEVAWVVLAVEVVIGCWAISRRGIDIAQLGAGVREPYRCVVEMLPIGREGEQVFDLRPVVRYLRGLPHYVPTDEDKFVAVPAT
ncbi:MAG: aromatic amino acid lyase [Myxococcales bacterium]|nr:aromatic amino acid lyase [Myxococcales bacterium]